MDWPGIYSRLFLCVSEQKDRENFYRGCSLELDCGFIIMLQTDPHVICGTGKGIF